MCEPFETYRSFQREGRSALEACMHARDAGLDNAAQTDMLQAVFEMTLAEARQTVQQSENRAFQRNEYQLELIGEPQAQKRPFQFSLKMIFLPPVAVALWMACFQHGIGFGLVILTFYLGALVAVAAKAIRRRTVIGWSMSMGMMMLANLIVLFAPWAWLAPGGFNQYNAAWVFPCMFWPAVIPAAIVNALLQGVLPFDVLMSIFSLLFVWISSLGCFRYDDGGCAWILSLLFCSSGIGALLRAF